MKFKNANEISQNLINRAVYLHNQICSLLMTSYENLQDHILKMSSYLNEYEKKNFKLGFYFICFSYFIDLKLNIHFLF